MAKIELDIVHGMAKRAFVVPPEQAAAASTPAAAPPAAPPPPVTSTVMQPAYNANSRKVVALNSAPRTAIGVASGQPSTKAPARPGVKLAEAVAEHYHLAGNSQWQKIAALAAPHPQEPVLPAPYATDSNAGVVPTSKKGGMPANTDRSMTRKDAGMPRKVGKVAPQAKLAGMRDVGERYDQPRAKALPPTGSVHKNPAGYALGQVAQDLTGFPFSSGVFSPKGRAAADSANYAQDQQAFKNTRDARGVVDTTKALTKDPRAYIALGAPAASAVTSLGATAGAATNVGSRVLSRVVGATGVGKNIAGAGAALGAGRAAAPAAAAAAPAHAGSGLLVPGIGAIASKVGPKAEQLFASAAGQAGRPLGHLGGHVAKHEVAVNATNAVTPSASQPTASAPGGRPPGMPTPAVKPIPAPVSAAPAPPKAPGGAVKVGSVWGRMLEKKAQQAPEDMTPFERAGGKLDARGNQDYATVPTNKLRQAGGNQPAWYAGARRGADAAADSGVSGFVNRGLAGTAELANKTLNYRLPGGETPGRLLNDFAIGMAGVGGPGRALSGPVRALSSTVNRAAAGAAQRATKAVVTGVHNAARTVGRGVDEAAPALAGPRLAPAGGPWMPPAAPSPMRQPMAGGSQGRVTQPVSRMAETSTTPPTTPPSTPASGTSSGGAAPVVEGIPRSSPPSRAGRGGLNPEAKELLSKLTSRLPAAANETDDAAKVVEKGLAISKGQSYADVWKAAKNAPPAKAKLPPEIEPGVGVFSRSVLNQAHNAGARVNSTESGPIGAAWKAAKEVGTVGTASSLLATGAAGAAGALEGTGKQLVNPQPGVRPSSAAANQAFTRARQAAGYTPLRGAYEVIDWFNRPASAAPQAAIKPAAIKPAAAAAIKPVEERQYSLDQMFGPPTK